MLYLYIFCTWFYGLLLLLSHVIMYLVIFWELLFNGTFSVEIIWNSIFVTFWGYFYLLVASTKICLLLIIILTWTSFLLDLIKIMNTNMNNFPWYFSLLVRVYIYSSFPWLPGLFSYFSLPRPLQYWYSRSVVLSQEWFCLYTGHLAKSGDVFGY